MTNVLWTDIDNYLIAAILADMGTGSAYTTLRLNEVLLSDTFKLDEYNPPTVVIFSNDVEPIEQGPYGDGNVHIHSEYPYFIACIDAPRTLYATSKANAQELTQRLREVVRSRFALGGLTSAIGETVEETEVENQRVEVLGGNVGGKYHGVGVMSFKVRSLI